MTEPLYMGFCIGCNRYEPIGSTGQCRRCKEKCTASGAPEPALPTERAVASEADAISALRDSIPSALETAIAQATFAHRGQVDKGGQPYILHPLRVMLACKTEEQRVVAMLHDVVEDTDITVSDIRHDFGDAVADAVQALTRCDGESYAAFIERCAKNAIARRVKLADLADNMDLSRLGREPTIEDARRCWKYGEARNVLMAAECAAQGTSASGQDGNRLEAQPAGPVGETDAPISQPTSPQPIPAEGGVKP